MDKDRDDQHSDAGEQATGNFFNLLHGFVFVLRVDHADAERKGGECFVQA